MNVSPFANGTSALLHLGGFVSKNMPVFNSVDNLNLCETLSGRNIMGTIVTANQTVQTVLNDSLIAKGALLVIGSAIIAHSNMSYVNRGVAAAADVDDELDKHDKQRVQLK